MTNTNQTHCRAECYGLPLIRKKQDKVVEQFLSKLLWNSAMILYLSEGVGNPFFIYSHEMHCKYILFTCTLKGTVLF